ncbi:hypothetical protein G9A89_010214 [Geosiphon pyriformis]|nr:hypothetical protein G9A89_010214 [Geosiphon pyriformis]
MGNFCCCFVEEEQTKPLMLRSQLLARQGYQSINESAIFDKSLHERLRVNHQVWQHFWDCDFISPVQVNFQYDAAVLDSGCGSGEWILGMSAKYPNVTFTGIDITRSMFPRGEFPFKIHFSQCDILDELHYLDGTFDLVHQRHMCDAFTKQMWNDHVIKELARVTKPGGWLECVEPDVGFIGDGPATQRLSDAVQLYCQNQGMIVFPSKELPLLLEINGLENVQVQEKDIVLGKRSGRYGEMALKSNIVRLMALKPSIKTTLGITDKEFNELIETFKREVVESPVNWKTYRIIGQKEFSRNFF